MMYRNLLNQRKMNDKNITCERVSSDQNINEYGNRLIEFCHGHFLYIWNCRIGSDSKEGDFTTIRKIIVDYIIGSPGVSIINMNDLAISNFDNISPGDESGIVTFFCTPLDNIGLMIF